MVGYKTHSLCKQAEVFYYDFLFNNGHKDIPLTINEHIDRCKYCKERIGQLGDMLSQNEGQSDSKENRLNFAKSILLELHFAYAGKRVTCQTVKPFLPSLLEAAIEIKIPTPITVHLDKCLQCREDLETIGNLGLNIKQLRRLSQFFAETSSPQQLNCSESQDAVSAVASMDFDNVNEDVLKHISICPECRNRLYLQRDSIIKELLHNNSGQEQFCYQDMPQADIFDYVIPYGLNPANDQYAKFRRVITSHLRECPTCLAKMQNLHNTIYAVAERNESEVVTTYHIDKQAETKADNESEGLYSGFPIRVEVDEYPEIIETKKQNSTINFITALKNKKLSETIKPLFKVAIVAAVILTGFTLLFNIPTAKAVTIEQICKAISRIQNVHISSFTSGREEPIQEIWVSRTLNIFMIKTDKDSVLWDLSKSVRKSKRAGTDSTETANLSEDISSSIQKRINSFLGLVPFNNISDIPANAKWEREAKEGSQTAAENTDVYDLIWVGKASDGTDMFYKWRVFVNPETMFPQKTELYEKLPFDEEYNLSTTMVVEYLSENEIKTSIEKASF